MDDTQTLNLAQFPGTANVTGTSDLVITTNQTNLPPGTEGMVREQATLDFGFKSDPVEVEYEGEWGLICDGYASKYLEEDGAGEEQQPGAFSIIAEEWGAQKEPLVLFNHALDTTLRGRPIGRGIGLKLEPDGLHVRVFVPRSAADKWSDARARKRFADVYQGIKNRTINAFSVGGAFWRMGKKLLNWATTEISITPTPCLGSATFTLGSKALTERYGGLPLTQEGLSEQSSVGRLTRSRWSSVMGFAKQDGDHRLHDHLLTTEPEYQGNHDSEDCTICADRRSMMGVKAQEPAPDSTASPAGGKMGDQESAVSGPASSQVPPAYAEVLKEATDLLLEFGQSTKSGKRHSKATRDSVATVVQHLTDFFELGSDGAEGDGDK